MRGESGRTLTTTSRSSASRRPMTAERYPERKISPAGGLPRCSMHHWARRDGSTASTRGDIRVRAPFGGGWSHPQTGVGSVEYCDDRDGEHRKRGNEHRSCDTDECCLDDIHSSGGGQRLEAQGGDRDERDWWLLVPPGQQLLLGYLRLAIGDRDTGKDAEEARDHEQDHGGDQPSVRGAGQAEGRLSGDDGDEAEQQGDQCARGRDDRSALLLERGPAAGFSIEQACDEGAVGLGRGICHISRSSVCGLRINARMFGATIAQPRLGSNLICFNAFSSSSCSGSLEVGVVCRVGGSSGVAICGSNRWWLARSVSRVAVSCLPREWSTSGCVQSTIWCPNRP